MSPFRIAFCAAAICLASAPAPAQKHSVRDLTEVGLEELMNIEVVSISKREQKLARTPAAVSILTHEDIRRSGATSIPEALRLVPGLQVAAIDAGRFAVTARGFNGQYSNKLLVMIDGRSVYTPLFSGVYWDMQDLLLEDIDRIEVIRGPGASLWGANAVNGVINILTKPAGQTQGGLLVAGTGNEEKGLLGFRYGGPLGPAAHYRIYTKYSQREALWRNPATLPADDWFMGRTGFRMDWEVSPKSSLSVQGQVFKSNNHQAVDEVSGQPPFAQTVYGELLSSGGFGMARWQHHISDTSDVSLAFYYDRYKREESIVGETRDTVDFDFQHRFRLAGRHQVLWGLEQRYTRDRTVGTAAAQLVPDRRGLNLTSAFVQDEVALAGDRLSLTLGSKFEHNAFTGLEVQPTVRLLWRPRENQSAWAAVSRAVRTPSRGEEDGVFHFPAQPGPGGLPLLVTYFGDRGLQPETLIAYEAGYRVQVTRRLSVEAATFYNVYRDLVNSALGRPDLQFAPAPHLEVPVRLQNGLGGETYGLEVSANWRPVERWRLSGAYTGLEIQLHAAPGLPSAGGERVEGSSPHHQFNLASYLDLTRTVQLDAMIYRVAALPGLNVPAYTRCDVRVGWRPRESLEVSVGSQNLSGHRQVEYVSDTFVRPTRVGRRIYGKLTWTF